MSETTIEWCRWTHNEAEGCNEVSPGCRKCFAKRRNARFNHGVAVNWGPLAPRRRTSEANRRKPHIWNRRVEREHAAWRETLARYGSAEAAAAAGREPPRRPLVFAGSLGDWADKLWPAQWRKELFATIRATPNLEWMLLTKRVGNAGHMIAQAGGWPGNAYLGISVCTQEEADRDIPRAIALKHQLGIPLLFVSFEPLLEAVDARRHMGRLPGQDDPSRCSCDGSAKGCSCAGLGSCTGIDWVLIGGEQDVDARPMLPAWVESLVAQAQEAGIPKLFKQWGSWGATAFNPAIGTPVFRQFDTFEQWGGKAPVRRHVYLDRHGRRLESAADFERARDEGAFPVTVMCKLSKEAAGRRLPDGRLLDEFPPPRHGQAAEAAQGDAAAAPGAGPARCRPRDAAQMDLFTTGGQQ